MKKEIVDALKIKFKHLGFSEKALDGVASYLEPSISDVSDIEGVNKYVARRVLTNIVYCLSVLPIVVWHNAPSSTKK